MSIFTSQDAVDTFKAVTGFTFHSTVPGQLLARRGVHESGVAPKARAFYAGEHWPQVWRDMLTLAHNRCRHQAELTPPKDCPPPPLPAGDHHG